MSSFVHWSRYMLEDNNDARLGEDLEARIQAGKAREALLAHWIAQDKEAGDTTFKKTRENWWESARTRLWPCRPLPMKLPKCLVEALGLPSQAAIVTGENEVWTIPTLPEEAPMRIVPVADMTAHTQAGDYYSAR